jgi:hypothetical protein
MPEVRSGGGRLIAVRTDVAASQLIAGLLEELLDRESSGPPGSDFEGTLERVAGADRAERAGRELRQLAARLGRAGYLARVLETERFQAARGSLPDIRAALRERTPEELSRQLAIDEPAERPDPDDVRAASWRIPGPGGHVRHYLAVVTARRLVRGIGVRDGIADPAELKRCWLYGFFVRCCEEARLN